MFAGIDTDGSGEIDFEEFSTLVKREAWVYELSSEEILLAWSKIDVDGGGTIELSEFARWWQGGPGSRFKQLRCTEAEKTKLDWAARAFRTADVDGNGSLDLDEFATLHASLCEMDVLPSGPRRESVDAVLRELDRNDDSLVVFGEFIAWMLRVGQFNELAVRQRATKISELGWNKVRIQIIGNERIENVGKSQSCMVSNELGWNKDGEGVADEAGVTAVAGTGTLRVHSNDSRPQPFVAVVQLSTVFTRARMALTSVVYGAGTPTSCV